jgi:hypothetical protein
LDWEQKNAGAVLPGLTPPVSTLYPPSAMNSTFQRPRLTYLLLSAGLLGIVKSSAAPATWAPVAGVVPASGFVVDTSSRLESLAFYNAAYLSSEGAAAHMGWTGNPGSCVPGTTSAVFRQDIRRRVNYYRALAGLPANITFDAQPVLNAALTGSPQVPATVSKQACAQAAADNIAFSNLSIPDFVVSHTPVESGNYCWSPEVWNGAYHSNLALGYFGPKAIDAYIADDGLEDDQANNANLGHRRWVLYSRARDMSSGDVPPTTVIDSRGVVFPVLPANALYVTSQFEPIATAPRKFVSWPPAGFVPVPLLPRRWSLSFPGANFSGNPASITLTGPGGNTLPITLLSFNTSLADNTLAFQSAAPLPAPGATDASYTVTITGISGNGVPASYTWRTTFFDPTVLGVPLTIAGSAQPPASGADYQCSPVPLATGWEVQAATLAPAGPLGENADSTAPLIVNQTTGTYPLLQGPGVLEGISFVPRSGSRAFHLSIPPRNSEPDGQPHAQSFALTPEFIPAAGCVLTFYEQFRWLFDTDRFSVEVSADGGTHWTEIHGRNGAYHFVPGADYDSTAWDSGWRARTLPLAAWAGQPVRLRCILRPGEVPFEGNGIHHGCYIDDISLSSVQRLQPSLPAQFPGPGFRFDSTLTGGPIAVGSQWLLRARPSIGTVFMGYSAPLIVTAQAAVAPGFAGTYPGLAGQPQGDADNDGIANFVEYAFALNPTVANSSSTLPQAVRSSSGLTLGFSIPAGITGITYGAECSTDLTRWTPVPNIGTGTQRNFTIPIVPGQKCFMRLRVTQAPP